MMINTIDQLAVDFMKITALSYANYSPFSLEYNSQEREVIAKQHIRAGECLGQVFGDPKYVWDITHSEYLIVDDDMILDVSHNVPRTLLTLIRDENMSANAANCKIVVCQDHTASTTHFFVYAITDIHPGEEVVYAITSFSDCDKCLHIQ